MSDDDRGDRQPSGDATRLLARLSSGDAAAADELLPLLYDQLRAAAGRLMSRQPGDHTLQPTALVNEAWLKLRPDQGTEWESHGHFLRVAARAMRHVLVDHARAARADKRGADAVKYPLDELLLEADERVGDVGAFDGALAALERVDAQGAQVVELRFFGGLTNAEVGRALGLSTPTVERRWRAARMFLRRALEEPE